MNTQKTATSEKQNEARRRNGALSKGPVTETGKRNSSRNSLRHGLLARTVTLDSESQPQFARLAESMRNLFHPTNQVECDLVENMTVCRWRLRRIWNIERTNISIEENRLGVSPDLQSLDPAAITGLAFRHLADNSRCLDLLNRYETRFDRQYNRSLARLDLLRQNTEKMRNEPAR